MEDPTWTFTRGDDHLSIVRHEDANGPVLMVTVNGSTRSYPFSDLAALVRYQSDMESFLIKSGWSFVAFSPDRRTGRDRRRFPRLTERRRWWTDGMLTLKKKISGR